jgi:PAS domain S-box-containing protein
MVRGAESNEIDASDLREILSAAPDPYLVLATDFTIVEVTNAYLSVTMTTREELLGRFVFDVFPDDPADREGGGGAARLRASLARVMAEKHPHTMPVQRYRIRRPVAEGGAFEQRYWKQHHTPVLDELGWVKYIIHRVEDVTELVEVQRQKLDRDRSFEEVSARSQHYIKLLDSAPDAIVVVGEDGRIQIINVQTEVLFGYRREELIGQRIDMLIPERFRRTHGDHLSRYFADPGARPMGSGLQLFGRRKDASELPIEVSLSPQGDDHGMTVSAAIRDISDRTRLETASRVTADRLASAVESIEHGFALFDGEDRLISCNSVFRRLAHEPSPGALVGKRYVDVLDGWLGDMEFGDDAARERFRTDRVVRRAQESTSVFDVRLHDGRSLRIIDRRTPEGGIVKTILDRTDDERHARELFEARAAAEAASAAKSEFLSSMSHELRTPLNAILGFAQLLRRDKREPLSDRHKERLTQILRGGEHLLRLIDDILDLARIEAGSVSVSPEPVSVTEVLDEVRRTLEPIALSQKIELAIDPLPPLAMITADRTRFAQILMNFGSNAIKYNRPQGSVRFGVTTPSPDRVRVTVRDTGYGIPVESHDKLFQPFQRAGQESGPIEGTGIGLVITKRLAELMAGTVGFRSVPGEGSEFWVEMPAHVTMQQPVLVPSHSAHAHATTTTNRPKRLVLYVEDNPANVIFMRDLIGGLDNIDLLTVPTAELGIDLARARHPDLVLMDINLPGMSGLDALGVLRSTDDTARIPVIALTAAASERDRTRGIEAGFYRYLTKPVQVDALIDAIESLLGARS